MIDVTCPSCAAKFHVAEELIAAKIVRFRCRRCGGAITVDGSAIASGPQAREPPAESPGDSSHLLSVLPPERAMAHARATPAKPHAATRIGLAPAAASPDEAAPGAEPPRPETAAVQTSSGTLRPGPALGAPPPAVPPPPPPLSFEAMPEPAVAESSPAQTGDPPGPSGTFPAPTEEPTGEATETAPRDSDASPASDRARGILRDLGQTRADSPVALGRQKETETARVGQPAPAWGDEPPPLAAAAPPEPAPQERPEPVSLSDVRITEPAPTRPRAVPEPEPVSVSDSRETEPVPTRPRTVADRSPRPAAASAETPIPAVSAPSPKPAEAVADASPAPPSSSPRRHGRVSAKLDALFAPPPSDDTDVPVDVEVPIEIEPEPLRPLPDVAFGSRALKPPPAPLFKKGLIDLSATAGGDDLESRSVPSLAFFGPGLDATDQLAALPVAPSPSQAPPPDAAEPGAKPRSRALLYGLVAAGVAITGALGVVVLRAAGWNGAGAPEASPGVADSRAAVAAVSASAREPVAATTATAPQTAATASAPAASVASSEAVAPVAAVASAAAEPAKEPGAAASAAPGARAAAEPGAVAKKDTAGQPAGAPAVAGAPPKAEGKAADKPPAEKPPEPKEAKTAGKPAPPAEADVPFDKAAAGAAIGAKKGAAASCKQEGGPTGHARVAITFAPSGRVTTANIAGPPFAGTPVGGCIASKFRGASVPPFSGGPVTVHTTVAIF